MIEKEFEFSNKEIKRLNDFNQGIKKINHSYYIFNDGIIVCEDGARILKKGFHCGYTSLFPLDLLDGEHVIWLISDVIYKTIRDNKKDIKKLKLLGRELLFCMADGSTVRIGLYYKLKDIKQEVINQYKRASNISRRQTAGMELTSEQVEMLMENELLVIKYDGYKVRITKELIPALKKDFDVKIQFSTVDDQEKLFKVTLIVDREILRSMHEYTCAKF